MQTVRLRLTLIIAATLLAAPPAYAQGTQTGIQKLLAGDAENDDGFSNAVATAGDNAVYGNTAAIATTDDRQD